MKKTKKRKKPVKGKKPTKRKTKTRSKSKTVKTDFLTKRKDIDDKFFDLVNLYTRKEFKKGKWTTKGISKLSKELEIAPRTIQKYINEGGINKKNEKLFINIERNFDKEKIKRTKRETKEFTVHNFTEKNFFPPKNLGRTNKFEQFYFRAGLYIVFEKTRERTRGNKKAGTTLWRYVVQNMPVSFYHKNYKEGYKLFFGKIKADLMQYPSLKFFRFNYIDVTKIDTRK